MDGFSLNFSSTVCILHHLDYMGGTGDGGILPVPGSLEAVMETDGQGDADPVPDTSGQDSEAAEHMSMDILGGCGVF